MAGNDLNYGNDLSFKSSKNKTMLILRAFLEQEDGIVSTFQFFKNNFFFRGGNGTNILA